MVDLLALALLSIGLMSRIMSSESSYGRALYALSTPLVVSRILFFAQLLPFQGPMVQVSKARFSALFNPVVVHLLLVISHMHTPDMNVVIRTIRVVHGRKPSAQCICLTCERRKIEVLLRERSFMIPFTPRESRGWCQYLHGLVKLLPETLKRCANVLICEGRVRSIA